MNVSCWSNGDIRGGSAKSLIWARDRTFSAIIDEGLSAVNPRNWETAERRRRRETAAPTKLQAALGEHPVVVPLEPRPSPFEMSPLRLIYTDAGRAKRMKPSLLRITVI